MKPVKVLRPYQQLIADFISSRYSSSVHVTMSLGKTAATLHGIWQLFNQLKIRGVLITAPKRVAQTVWEAEARDWAKTRGFRISTIMGKPEQRLKALQTPADIYIINYEGIQWLVPWVEYLWLRKGQYPPFDCWVADESTILKHAHSSKAKRMQMFQRLLPYLPYRIGLTGKPAPKGYLDLFGQYYMIDGGQSLGLSYGRYESTYFYAVDHSGYILKPKQGAMAAIDARIAPGTISLHAEDYLTLPDFVFNNLEFDLQPKDRKLYDRFEADLFAVLATGTNIESPNAAASRNKVQQIASGFVYTDTETKAWESIHDSKLDMLAEVVESAGGAPMLVAYQFVPDRERILKRFPQAVLIGSGVNDSDNLMRMQAWNNGEIEMAVIHPQSMGHGLNLQFGGHTIVWYNLTWNADHYDQLNHRLRRPGQANTHVVVHHIVARDTVDQAILSRLAMYAKQEGHLWDGMRDYMQSRGWTPANLSATI